MKVRYLLMCLILSAFVGVVGELRADGLSPGEPIQLPKDAGPPELGAPPSPNTPAEQVRSQALAGPCGCGSPRIECPSPHCEEPAEHCCRPCSTPCISRRPAYSRIRTPRRKIIVEMSPPEVIIRPAGGTDSGHGGFLKRCGHFFSRTVIRSHGHRPTVPAAPPMVFQPQAFMVQPQTFAVQPQAVAVQPQTFVQPQMMAVQPQTFAVAAPQMLGVQAQAVAPQPMLLQQPQMITTQAIAPQTMVIQQPQMITTQAVTPQYVVVQPRQQAETQLEKQSAKTQSLEGQDELNKTLKKLAVTCDRLGQVVDAHTKILVDHEKRLNACEAVLKQFDDPNTPKTETVADAWNVLKGVVNAHGGHINTLNQRVEKLEKKN